VFSECHGQSFKYFLQAPDSVPIPCVCKRGARPLGALFTHYVTKIDRSSAKTSLKIGICRILRIFGFAKCNDMAYPGTVNQAHLPTSFPGARVLVVEDLVALAIQYRTLAARLGVDVVTAGTLAQAKLAAKQGPWHAALVDLNLPDGNGFEVMEALLAEEPGCSVVVVTAEDSLDNAMRASDAGAFDFIEKPVEAERLLVTLRNALHTAGLAQQVQRLSLDKEGPQQFEQFTGHSPQMQTVYRMLETVATSNAPVCIVGESGTGKELAAHAVHSRSPRKNKAFVPINCAAIPRELIESELFGHVKGAFTGASVDRTGAFNAADKGTLFLDEIAELNVSVQAKLLRALQTGEIKRLGEDKTRRVDVRIVCATHRNLAQLVRDGSFREDLFYRLYVVPIELPPLRERGDDITLIARELLRRYAKEDGKRFEDFSADALQHLQAHHWPGNVRELVNVVRAVVALHDGLLVEPAMLPNSLLTQTQAAVRRNAHAAAPPSLGGAPLWFSTSAAPLGGPQPASNTVAFDRAKVRPLLDLEREAVDFALGAFNGNVAQAAKALQINPSTLYRKIQAWTAQGWRSTGVSA
jgi:two-component system, repressor protein LuxO